MKGVILGLLVLVVLAGCVKSVSKQASDFCKDLGMSFGFEHGTCYKINSEGNLTFEKRLCILTSDDGKENFYFEKNGGGC